MRLKKDFYLQDVLNVAPALIGKLLVINNQHTLKRYIISETEAYRGEEDLACHASKGRTKRTEIMYGTGGSVYVYLIYGMYWLLNVVTGDSGVPQAALIRGVEGVSGPGRLGKVIGLDRSYYGENLVISDRIWIEDTANKVSYSTSERIGIEYSGDFWKSKPWRFCINH